MIIRPGLPVPPARQPIAAKGPRPTRKSPDRPPHVDTDQAGLLHELQVRQVELEMQNEELRASLAEAEKLHQRCSDFFDFAPVGYFSLERTGVNAQTNLVGARLLGLECASLPGKRFGAFVAEADQPVFNDFLRQVFAAEARQTWRWPW